VAVIRLLLIPVLEALFRFVVAERMGTIILSALVAHTAWHWMLDRADRLRQFHFQRAADHRRAARRRDTLADANRDRRRAYLAGWVFRHRQATATSGG
jgi:hypothetical protein